MSLLPWKDLPKLCVYGMYSCHFHSALTEIRMSSKCSQKAEGSDRAHVRARWHHIGCLSESWHCILMHMVCWFTEPAALMKSPSIGSLQCLLKTMLGVIGWKTRADPPTAACPEVWKSTHQKVRHPQAIRQGQMKRAITIILHLGELQA